jgi:hypothetical protein
MLGLGAGAAAASSAPLLPRQMPTPEVTTVLNAMRIGVASSITNTPGWLVAVAPLSLDGTAIRRGRIYAEAWAVDGSGNRVLCLWCGYLSCGADARAVPAGAVSTPGLLWDPAWNVIVVATHASQGAPTRVGFQCVIDPNGPPPGLGSIHHEDPGTGPGEMIAADLAGPAAGADCAVQTVPACVTRRLVSIDSSMVTGAAAASRVLIVRFKDPTAILVARACQSVPVTASQSLPGCWYVGAGLGGSAGLAQTCPLPGHQMPAGSTWQLTCLNIQAADQFGSFRAGAEEWAVPA